MAPDNLFSADLADNTAEVFETLLQCRNVTIERILSPPGSSSGMFNQSQDEWVCLLQGEATLEMAGRKIRLSTGQTLFIPAGTPHQVVDTSGDPGCIWLAVHIH